VGDNVRRWGFIELFTPWELNVTPLGLAELSRVGKSTPAPQAYPTGNDFVAQYLRPVALALGNVVQTGTEVVALARSGLLKGDDVGGKARAQRPFRLLLRRGDLEQEAEADVVLDATGVYDNPGFIGDGGAPATGETSLRSVLDYQLVDLCGPRRSEFAGKTVLLVGGGFSAATTLLALLRLQKENAETRIVWLRRSVEPAPFPSYPNDPLPARALLAREGNRIAAAPPACCTQIAGAIVSSLCRERGRLRVGLRRPGTGTSEGGSLDALVVDRVIANVGYRPATELYRELQVHQCYASEGPMALAAALLGGSTSGDCLEQVGQGPDALKTSEPGFFIIGHKSYGRRSDFLLRIGFEQVRDVFRLIERQPELDLYRNPQAGSISEVRRRARGVPEFGHEVNVTDFVDQSTEYE
jgi:hypothetical protein